MRLTKRRVMSHLSSYLFALAVGLVIGLERERSQSMTNRLAYGIRTFALLGLLGALVAQVGAVAVGVGLLVVGALLVVGYARTNQTDPGTTTEVAALATYLLGVLAWSDAAAAAALALVVVALLMGKDRLHRFVSDVLSDAEMEDALKFLIGAFVILPLLPRRDVGPYGIFNPAQIWLIVVAVTGVSWAGYILVRLLGERRGQRLAGLAGGFVSATATTLAMARRSRTSGDVASALAGALAASAVTFLELFVVVMALSVPIGVRILPGCALGVAGLALATLRPSIRRRSQATHFDEQAEGVRVISLIPALSLAGVITATLLVARWAGAHFGSRLAVASIAVAGLGDAHGGSISAVTLFARGAMSQTSSIVAIGLAVSANALVKVVLAHVAGGREFARRFAPPMIIAHVMFLVGLGVALWISA